VAALPLATYEPSEIVLAAGSKTGPPLILKEGAVAITGAGIKIAVTRDELNKTIEKIQGLIGGI
jgi:hypothetical protein